MTTTELTGRELDAAVAIELFGWQWWKSASTGRRCLWSPTWKNPWFTEPSDGTEDLVSDWNDGEVCSLPHYSSMDFWLVVTEMQRRGWQCRFWHAKDAQNEWGFFHPTEDYYADVSGPDCAANCCRAALAALAAEREAKT